MPPSGAEPRHGVAHSPIGRTRKLRSQRAGSRKRAACYHGGAMPRRRTTEGGFRGFDRDAMQFWHELASEMSRHWFTANKQRYHSQWVEPMLALLREVARGLAATYRPFALAEPGVLRIYRDLRFARDKA